MIDWLEINQFAIAEQMELEFGSNFTTITGETGAGKSLIVDAIDILLGHRSDSSYIRHGHDTAWIQAGFAVPPGHPALLWLQEHEMAIRNECILRRVLRRNRPSKGYINGHAATAAQLRDIGGELVDIHGQNEHHSLLKKSTQRHLLDSAADNLDHIAGLGNCYDVLADVTQQIDQLQDQNHINQERTDLTKFQIEELSELDPRPGEWESLESMHKRLNHQQELTTGTQKIADELYESDSDNISRRLLQCSQQLEHLSEYAAELKLINDILDEAQINLQEAASRLQPFYQDGDIDPEQMETIESRFSQYHSLARKHRVQPHALHQHLEHLKKELNNLKDPESELQELRQRYTTELKKYEEIADRVSLSRRKSAEKLAGEVTEIMQELGMQGGEIDVRLTRAEQNLFTRYGNESVEFLVSTNPGHPLQALNKVASGGELSRISLAIQVVLANKVQVPTLIFDEVDMGIGGEIAHVVGQKLKALGQSAQVICVTHLSQVAARGDHHFRVSKHAQETGDKANRENKVGTTVTMLNSQQRVEEIARMTGGEKITQQSVAHARQMLKSA